MFRSICRTVVMLALVAPAGIAAGQTSEGPHTRAVPMQEELAVEDRSGDMVFTRSYRFRLLHDH